ncbi:hypothetical protein [Enterococcus hirae]|uniref:hypothetical protein n=1 Tax=Enterococcus hirae TaxID=1354 RepID=UPI001370BAA8|nr:hypothetical protein [Enterococcus hirae]NAE18075.1 hypothetical protein [Enterococcus hirae]
MVQRRRYATRAELTELVEREFVRPLVGEPVEAVLDVLAQHDVDLDALVKITVDEPLP